MEKSRIPLNVDQDLREIFEERINALNEKMSLTFALTSAMYSMIYMTNAELYQFIIGGGINEAATPAYKKLFKQAKEEGIIPENIVMGNPQVQNLYTALVEHYVGEKDDKEATLSNIQKVLKVIENSDILKLSEIMKKIKFED